MRSSATKSGPPKPISEILLAFADGLLETYRAAGGTMVKLSAK